MPLSISISLVEEYENYTTTNERKNTASSQENGIRVFFHLGVKQPNCQIAFWKIICHGASVSIYLSLSIL